MKELVKKIIRFTPIQIRYFAIWVYETYFSFIYKKKDNVKKYETKKKPTENILIFHESVLNHGGTQKNLQYIANGLVNDFNVFILYSSKTTNNPRFDFIDKKIKLIDFSFDQKINHFPFYLENMKPKINDVIRKNNIDLVITATSGYSDYPINTILSTPIILINIFGSPTTNKNVIKNIYISNEVKRKAEFYNRNKNGEVLYIPTNKPRKDYLEEARDLRKKYNIPENDFAFGRIGRDSNDIFDPIGIKAFKKLYEKYNNVHYLIMSPPPILKNIVKEENIKNVHFIDSSSNENDIWAFHFTIDCLAHFRNDGESCGLNIAESMTVGNPIISHKSHIWNAHTEYLDPSFSRVAEKDNVEQYYQYMKEFLEINKKTPDIFDHMRIRAKEVAEKKFGLDKYMEKIINIIKNIK